MGQKITHTDTDQNIYLEMAMKTYQSRYEQSADFDHSGRFILRDFDHKRPFSSFLPGIAGLRGIPMWAFYVNRGQALCSFGVENKDHPILEFQTANKAYQHTPVVGFRTFLNGLRSGEKWKQEVFSPWAAHDMQRTMTIGMNDLEIEEINTALGYQVNVLYFILPNMPFSGLVRRVELKNLGDSPLALEVLDGLPTIVPYGVDNGFLKNLGRTIEAWMQVDNLENRLPFYHLRATPGDTTEVSRIRAGNYALSLVKDTLMPAVADPKVIFGLDTSCSEAHCFNDRGLKKIQEAVQILEGHSLCAFFGTNLFLEPDESQIFTSLYGYAPSLSTIQSSLETFGKPGFFDQKLCEARGLTRDLTDKVHTESGLTHFNGYCRQTFLDNLIRGGYPLILGHEQVYHVYSRKHGDIERDYNYFVIPPEFYSQGNGNFRDINQNRRNDVYFVPEAGEFNIRLFMSLIQADGYNPLVINGLKFTLPSDQVAELSGCAHHQVELGQILSREFVPGELFDALQRAELTIPAGDFMERVFSIAEAHIQAEHGEGYWIDHWTYNLDLIEAYLAIFPDRQDYLLFDSEPLPFFDDEHIVQPRSERYVDYQGRPRQFQAVKVDPEKAALIGSRQEAEHWARADHGAGGIFRLPLISKLGLLALIKFATLDPSGMGIQMEADKPGWYDALNGLPGLFGSSMPETYELQRLVNFLMDVLSQTSRDVRLPIEVEILLDAIKSIADFNLELFETWDRMSTALEGYRASIRLGFDGEITPIDLMPILTVMERKLARGIEKAQTYASEGIPPTYFIHHVTDYVLGDPGDEHNNAHIMVKRFEPEALPPFLEGPVRLLKLSTRETAQKIASVIKHSDLFDQKLGMYKINMSLAAESHEIGRARAFTAGWLENESIWMHMSFKYMLELLRAGLYEEFFEALKTHLPAFMDPDIYGRSPLENSSFIVSSVHPDSSLHGNGFVARLSGSTAEFLSMWWLMTVGEQPFRYEKGQLQLAFNPALPGWLFTEQGRFTFRFLGCCDVTLVNPSRMDTYQPGREIKEIKLYREDEAISIKGAVIKSPYAQRVRSGEFDRIECFY